MTTLSDSHHYEKFAQHDEKDYILRRLVNNATTAFVTSQDGLYERAFLAPGMCVATFHHTTQVIGLEDCHVKASYGGVLLVMTLLDGNGNVFIAALGIAESENSSSWEWFLAQVKTAFNIEDDHGLVFLSDREKGIDGGVRHVFPRANHSLCVYHIEKKPEETSSHLTQWTCFQGSKSCDPEGV